MEFEEVSNYIRNNSISSQRGPAGEEPPNGNPYHALIQQQAEPRKPTLSNFVSRLKQQSSKTRFVREYKKMLVSDITSDDDGSLEDDASIRIIDPTRNYVARGSSAEEESYDEYESDASTSQQVMNLMIGSKAEKQPLNNKRVKINEGANQIQGEQQTVTITTETETEEEREYMTMEAAIQRIQQQEIDQLNAIQYQMRRIEIQKDNITKYKQDLLNMQKQMDFYNESLTTIKTDHVPDMKTHYVNAIKNVELLKENRKRNLVLKSRFDRYRKVRSLDVRLQEMEKKIQLAWKRDDIWGAIRDWGLLLALIFVLVVTSFIAWRTG